MILITGAAGKTGKAVLRALAKEGGLVKALVFRSEQIQPVAELGAKDVLVGDMRDLDTLKQAMQGVHSVYHICPNVHPDEITIGQKIIAVAAAAGITHFVYHSVLHPQVEAMPHHWKKMHVEDRLFKSGLPYTILQPATYMQNILANWDNIDKTGKYILPYAVESRISMVDLEDIAQVAAIVLQEAGPKEDRPAHNGATYELVGTPAMPQTEVAETLSRHLGRPVIAEQQPIDAWKQSARASGMGDYQLNTLVKMFNYYDKYGFSGDSHVLGWLLNRPATSLDAFLARVEEDRSPSAQLIRRSHSI
ncbi:MAG: NmrA family NAD(P)-binding protein [Anaerolineales bacterium]|jgi:NAD(P)H dehydrogenase (quinone)